MRRNGYNTRMARKGFSIIELLIALIIIGILAAILIPLISNRSQQARVRAAESDLERLATGMDMVAVDTGYFPRLFMLNDSSGPDRDGGLQQFSFTGGGDDTNRQYNNLGGNPVVRLPNQLFLYTYYPRVGVPVDPGLGADLRDRLVVSETEFNWNGSYVNWKDDANLVDSTGAYPDGIPDDPWGNNYMLFVPNGDSIDGVSSQGGLVNEDVAASGALVSQTFDFPGTAGGTACNIFDRPTLLSLGPNGVPGDPPSFDIGTGDDIVREFGP